MKKFFYCVLALLVSCIYCSASVQSDYMSAREAFYKREYQSAIKHYDNVLTKDDTYIDAYCGKGEAEIELKKFDDAIKSYSKALELDENNVDALIGRATAYGLKQRPNLKLALEDLNKALEINPNNMDAYVARAAVYYGLKDKESAHKDVDYVLEIEPNNPQAHVLKAMLEFSDFKFGGAIKHFGIYKELNDKQEEVKNTEPKFER